MGQPTFPANSGFFLGVCYWTCRLKRCLTCKRRHGRELFDSKVRRSKTTIDGALRFDEYFRRPVAPSVPHHLSFCPGSCAIVAAITARATLSRHCANRLMTLKPH